MDSGARVFPPRVRPRTTSNILEAQHQSPSPAGGWALVILMAAVRGSAPASTGFGEIGFEPPTIVELPVAKLLAHHLAHAAGWGKAGARAARSTAILASDPVADHFHPDGCRSLPRLHAGHPDLAQAHTTVTILIGLEGLFDILLDHKAGRTVGSPTAKRRHPKKDIQQRSGQSSRPPEVESPIHPNSVDASMPKHVFYLPKIGSDKK